VVDKEMFPQAHQVVLVVEETVEILVILTVLLAVLILAEAAVALDREVATVLVLVVQAL